jgi:hypothetical protein
LNSRQSHKPHIGTKKNIRGYAEPFHDYFVALALNAKFVALALNAKNMPAGCLS